MVDIKKELDSYQILLSILSNDYYNESLIRILKQLSNGKICYVSLNKTTDSLVKNFKSNSIDIGNMFFIDAVTKSVSPNKSYSNSILISSPYALTELGIAISEILKTKAFDILVFDSLSTLGIYKREKSVTEFTSQIINKIRANEDKGIFTCLEDDMNSDLIRKSSMFVDKIVKIDMKEEMDKKIMKNAAVAVFTVIALAITSLFLQPTPTGMAIAENNPVGNPTAVTALLGLLLVVVIFLMYKLSQHPEIIKVGKIENRYNQKNKKIIRKQFKDKIYGWLNANLSKIWV